MISATGARMAVAGDAVWSIPPQLLRPRHDEVHVWLSRLETSRSRVGRLSEMLSGDERLRARRFHFERDRCDFIVARAGLRILIGRYLQREPSRVEFRYGPNGKPFVDDERTALRFNLSHSRGLALYAFTSGREIGVDIERLSEDLEVDRLATHYFSSDEVAALRALPRSARTRAFFACWTRKEAYLKARGAGLSIALDSFTVSLRPDEPAALLDVQGSANEISRWSLSELAVDPSYAAALVVEGRDWLPRRWTFDRDDAGTTGCTHYKLRGELNVEQDS